jgi:hypothetical protein
MGDTLVAGYSAYALVFLNYKGERLFDARERTDGTKQTR